MTDHALDALLAEYAPPPPSAGLAARAVAAALALPQDSLLANGRKVAARPRHDRRATWVRRPMLIGAVALGLAVSGAVAATLAGVKLDSIPLVQAILRGLGSLVRVPDAAPPRRAAPPETAPPPVEAAPVPQEPAAAPRVLEPPAPRAAPPRTVEPPAAAPVEAPPTPAIVGAQRVERPMLPPTPTPAAPPLASLPPAVREEGTVATIVEARRAPAPLAGEQLRLQREQIERTERLRAVRQAQIERLQRIQQSRERIRRLRRD
jgi:hypothetical protein